MSLLLSGDDGASKIYDTLIPAALNATGNAPMFVCRAWVNFNGAGTVAIRESGNVSSITDNGTGLYTINFTVSMPDANYSLAGGGGRTGAGVSVSETSTSPVRSVSALKIGSYGAGSSIDYDYISVLIFR